MEIKKQILILAANKPGTLANICGTLSDEKINIQGLTIVNHVDFALIRMVVDDETRALHLLGEAGLPVVEDEVIKITMPEGPGALEKIAETLGDAGLNISYAYASEPPGGGKSTLVLKTSDDQAAIKALQKVIK